MGKFLIRPVDTGIKFDLKAPNGQVILTSEVYKTRAACLRGIGSVCKNAPKAKLEDQTDPADNPVTNPKFELYQDKNGLFRFRLKARNGESIGFSDSYTTRASCLSGIESVRRNACDAEIQDE